MAQRMIMKADGTFSAEDELELAEPVDGPGAARVYLAAKVVGIERSRLLRTFDYVRNRALMGELEPGERGLSRRKWNREVDRLLGDLAGRGGGGLLLREPIEAAFDVAMARWAWSREVHGGLRYETCLPDPRVLDERGWRFGVPETPARLYGARRARLEAVPRVERIGDEGGGCLPAPGDRALADAGKTGELPLISDVSHI